jgi:hypothetical protein
MTAITNLGRGMIQRRLWPLAVLLVAALAAIPAVLAKDPEPVPVPVMDKDTGGESALTTQPIVAAADPAQRDRVREVVGQRKNPFKPVLEVEAESETADSESLVTAPSSSGSTSPAGGGPNHQNDSTGGATPPPTTSPAPAPAPAPRIQFYNFELTVRFGEVGEERPAKVLPTLSTLPSARNMVLTYMGLMDDHKTAVFQVQAGVEVDTDGSCMPSRSNCTILKLGKGEHATLKVPSSSDDKPVRYRLDYVDVEMVPVATPDTAQQARTSKVSERRTSLEGLVEQTVAYGAKP